MRHERADSSSWRIWIAGDLSDARRACREFTMRGLCVAVQQTEFIYTMGAESGDAGALAYINAAFDDKSFYREPGDGESLR